MRRFLFALLAVAAVAAACTDPGGAVEEADPPVVQSGPTSTSSTTTAPSSPTTMPATTTTTTSTTSTSTSTSTPPVPPPGPAGVEVYLPEDPSGAAVAVLVHGGGWVAGSPESMQPLGEALARRGMVAFNASYRTGRDGGGYPASFEDVACAVRYARTAGAALGAEGDLTLVGHSAGAHLSASVATAEDGFDGECRWEGSSTPDVLVGLAGIYSPDAVAPIMELFLGGDRAEAPEAWAAADPFTKLDAAGSFRTELIHGLDDRIVAAEASEQFVVALADAGAEAEVTLIEGGHNDVLDPSVTADLIAP